MSEKNEKAYDLVFYLNLLTTHSVYTIFNDVILAVLAVGGLFLFENMWVRASLFLGVIALMLQNWFNTLLIENITGENDYDIHDLEYTAVLPYMLILTPYFISVIAKVV